jgi:hypothetical protein
VTGRAASRMTAATGIVIVWGMASFLCQRHFRAQSENARPRDSYSAAGDLPRN